MEIIKYGVVLNEDRLAVLVKESATEYAGNTIFETPEKIVRMMNKVFKMDCLAEEYCYMLAFDSAMHIGGSCEISHGAVNYTVCNPREVFSRALWCGAVNIVIVHNHPSGSIIPSADDDKMFARMKEAGMLLGINVVDSIIIGHNEHHSNAYYSYQNHANAK